MPTFVVRRSSIERGSPCTTAELIAAAFTGRAVYASSGDLFGLLGL
jgi:hypothetical protein